MLCELTRKRPDYRKEQKHRPSPEKLREYKFDEFSYKVVRPFINQFTHPGRLTCDQMLFGRCECIPDYNLAILRRAYQMPLVHRPIQTEHFTEMTFQDSSLLYTPAS